MSEKEKLVDSKWKQLKSTEFNEQIQLLADKLQNQLKQEKEELEAREERFDKRMKQETDKLNKLENESNARMNKREKNIIRQEMLLEFKQDSLKRNIERNDNYFCSCIMYENVLKQQMKEFEDDLMGQISKFESLNIKQTINRLKYDTALLCSSLAKLQDTCNKKRDNFGIKRNLRNATPNKLEMVEKMNELRQKWEKLEHWLENQFCSFWDNFKVHFKDQCLELMKNVNSKRPNWNNEFKTDKNGNILNKKTNQIIKEYGNIDEVYDPSLRCLLISNETNSKEIWLDQEMDNINDENNNIMNEKAITSQSQQCDYKRYTQNFAVRSNPRLCEPVTSDRMRAETGLNRPNSVSNLIERCSMSPNVKKIEPNNRSNVNCNRKPKLRRTKAIKNINVNKIEKNDSGDESSSESDSQSESFSSQNESESESESDASSDENDESFGSNESDIEDLQWKGTVLMSDDSDDNDASGSENGRKRRNSNSWIEEDLLFV